RIQLLLAGVAAFENGYAGLFVLATDGLDEGLDLPLRALQTLERRAARGLHQFGKLALGANGFGPRTLIDLHAQRSGRDLQGDGLAVAPDLHGQETRFLGETGFLFSFALDRGPEVG